MSEENRTDVFARVEASETRCRFCGVDAGEVVLDLGNQPASDYFPSTSEPHVDPVYPLQMWLCSSCGLAQLLSDPTIPEEPLATEPAALTGQAAAAVAQLAEAGWLEPGHRAIEYGSPHGGSWLPLLAERGLKAATDGERAEIVLDCFGLMHEADQYKAIVERTSQVAPGGTLFVQFHSVATIVRLGQWNSLRHGHYAYYSTTALAGMLASAGFQAVRAWGFDLYGGTVLLAAKHATDSPALSLNKSISALHDEEAAMQIAMPDAFRDLERTADRDARVVRSWLTEQRRHGRKVIAYGAGSSVVALLCKAKVGRDLLPGIGDASVAKHGRRMPGTEIPVVSPTELVAHKPDVILLLLPDLLAEVRATLPEVEASGGGWVTVQELRGAFAR